MDSSVLLRMVDEVGEHEIDSVTIIRNGYMVLDATFYPFPESTEHIIHSCTKSIVGTLIGLLIEDGLVEGVDQPVVELLPESAPTEIDETKAAMTVADLLTMSTGLDCRDSYLYNWEGLGEMRRTLDWAAYVLGLDMREDPGTRFEYCNGSSHLLSTIVARATGDSTLDYAISRLFEPLGIARVTWPANFEGVNHGWGDMRLTPHDMAKFGYLYLRDGWWDGERILPEGWVASATARHITASTLNDSYGYQWWIDATTYSALGFAGQYIIVHPDLDLVVVFTSGLGGREFELPRDLFDRYILTSILSNNQLPPNETATTQLRDAITAAVAPPPPIQPTDPPAIAADISGIRYTLAPNDGAFEWFELGFGDDVARMQMEDRDGPIDVTIGLDGVARTTDAWGSLWAFSGEWVDENTFQVYWQIVGRAARGTFTFDFDGDEVRMAFVVHTTGTATRATGEVAG